jgi:hypothetical protein
MMHEPEFVFFPPSLSRRDIAVCFALCVFLLYSQKFLLLLLLFSLFLFLAAFLYFFSRPLLLLLPLFHVVLLLDATRTFWAVRFSSLSLAFLWNSVTRGAGLLVVAVVIVDRLARKSTEPDSLIVSCLASEMRQENERKNKRIITKYKSKYLKTHNKTKKSKKRKIKTHTGEITERVPVGFDPL